MILNTSKIYRQILEIELPKHKNIVFHVRNYCKVSLSFSARKSKFELKIAMKTWEILKATYLIALLLISNENTACLFEISTYIKCDIKGGGGVRLISYSGSRKRRVGHSPSCGFFSGE